MGNADKRFDVSVSGENKGKDQFTFTFEFKITSDSNCRIKICSCQVYDLDGNMYQAKGNKISSSDIIIGVSKYFNDTKKVNASIDKSYKSRIGCSLVLTLADLDEKTKMNVCYQKKSAVRWDEVGVQMLEYEDIIPDDISATNKIEAEIDEINADMEAEEQAAKTEIQMEAATEVEALDEATESEEIEAEEAEEAEDEEADAEKVEAETVKGSGDFEEPSIGETVVTKESEVEESAADEVEEAADHALSGREMSGIEKLLNAILEYDEEASRKIGLVLDHVFLSAQENGNNYVVTLNCNPSPSTERRLMVRCPMIKAFFYDARGSIDNVAMARMSMLSDIDEAVEITIKKAPLKYWENLSKIKIMATV